jgi:proteic killer suppression protein
VIQSFACKETRKVYDGEVSRKLPRDIQSITRRKLAMLDYAVQLLDLRVPPANQLEALKGDRKGQYSIRVNRQWRVCFTWSENGPADVEIVDYH